MTWFLVEQGANPSSDYFVKPALVGEILEVFNLQSGELPTSEVQANLVFVRYLSPRWRRWVELNRSKLGRLVFFMDDDLFDWKSHIGLPLRYRWKLFQLAGRHKVWLLSQGFELWVSSPWLADKYSSWNPQLLQPRSPYLTGLQQKTFFYHGSASHLQEIRWLLPVAEEVLYRDPSFSFELIGNPEVRGLFSHLPRVHVLQPMGWVAYKALISRPGRTVGLAPLLPGNFNQARAPTKFFDITQAGAVGIYADHPVYQSLVKDRFNGLVLPMDTGLWVNAVLSLGCDKGMQKYLLENARAVT